MSLTSPDYDVTDLKSWGIDRYQSPVVGSARVGTGAPPSQGVKKRVHVTVQPRALWPRFDLCFKRFQMFHALFTITNGSQEIHDGSKLVQLQMPSTCELSELAVKCIWSAIVKALYRVYTHSHLVVEFLCFFAPVYLKFVQVVRRRVGRGITQHHQRTLRVWCPGKFFTDLGGNSRISA